MDSIQNPQVPEEEWVRESRFGRWFLTTNMWLDYVLKEAIFDLTKLLRQSIVAPRHILDVGCHQGLAFELLEQHFQPKTIIGIDIDKEQIPFARDAANRCQCPVKVEHGTVYQLNLPDNSIDVIFCHQLFHHLSAQTKALQELYRVLTPGGVVLIGESCRSFIHSLAIRILFRHPPHVQRTASEYVDLVQSVGFQIDREEIQTSTPWWSRKDYGLAEKLGWPQKPHEVTEVLIIARKPLNL